LLLLEELLRCCKWMFLFGINVIAIFLDMMSVMIIRISCIIIIVVVIRIITITIRIIVATYMRFRRECLIMICTPSSYRCHGVIHFLSVEVFRSYMVINVIVVVIAAARHGIAEASMVTTFLDLMIAHKITAIIKIEVVVVVGAALMRIQERVEIIRIRRWLGK